MLTEQEKAATARKKRIEKYFNPSPSSGGTAKAVLIFLIGIVVFGVGGGLVASVAALGYVFIVVGLYFFVRGGWRLCTYAVAYARSRPKPSGYELDRYLAEDLVNIRERAMRELDLVSTDLETGDTEWDPVEALTKGELGGEPERQPILVFGPDPASGLTVGKDKVWRFRAYEVMVICPTKHHLALYCADLDFLTGGLSSQETQEYQYAHVVSVSTVAVPADSELALFRTDRKRDKERRKDKKSVRFARVMLKQFELGVSSGRSAHVTVGISDQEKPGEEARLPDAGIQQVIASVRRVLRDKKGGFG